MQPSRLKDLQPQLGASLRFEPPALDAAFWRQSLRGETAVAATYLAIALLACWQWTLRKGWHAALLALHPPVLLLAGFWALFQAQPAWYLRHRLAAVTAFRLLMIVLPALALNFGADAVEQVANLGSPVPTLLLKVLLLSQVLLQPFEAIGANVPLPAQAAILFTKAWVICATRAFSVLAHMGAADPALEAAASELLAGWSAIVQGPNSAFQVEEHAGLAGRSCSISRLSLAATLTANCLVAWLAWQWQWRQQRGFLLSVMRAARREPSRTLLLAPGGALPSPGGKAAPRERAGSGEQGVRISLEQLRRLHDCSPPALLLADAPRSSLARRLGLQLAVAWGAANVCLMLADLALLQLLPALALATGSSGWLDAFCPPSPAAAARQAAQQAATDARLLCSTAMVWLGVA